MTRGLYVTGTDTGVGKTRVTAALAAALRACGAQPTVVKLVQTGTEHDAAEAGALAGCASVELARFVLPADAWSAALAEGAEPLDAATLAARLARAAAPPLVVEGSGGAAVPLNARESVSDVAAAAGLPAVIAVGLRLGCLNHALLSAAYLRARGIPVAAFVLIDRWETSSQAYRADVVRVLEPYAPLAATLAHEPDAAQSIRRAAADLVPWVRAAFSA